MSDKRLPQLGDKVIYTFGSHERKPNGAEQAVAFVVRTWGGGDPGGKRMCNIHVLYDCADLATGPGTMALGSRYHADDADPSWQGGVWRFADEA